MIKKTTTNIRHTKLHLFVDHSFAYISLDAMIPQEADQTHRVWVSCALSRVTEIKVLNTSERIKRDLNLNSYQVSTVCMYLVNNEGKSIFKMFGGSSILPKAIVRHCRKSLEHY